MIKNNVVVYSDGLGGYFYDFEYPRKYDRIGSKPMKEYEPVAVVKGPVTVKIDQFGRGLIMDGKHERGAIAVVNLPNNLQIVRL